MAEYTYSSSSSEDGDMHPIDGNRRTAFDYIDKSVYNGIMKDVLINEVKAVEKKIQSGKSVRVIDNNGNTLIHLAVYSFKNDDFTMIDFLLEQEDLDVNTTNHVGRTPLLESIKHSKTSLALHLIEKGARVDFPECPTPLHECCKSGLIKVAERLIDKGADVNAPDIEADTPLHIAVIHRQLDITYMLLYHGAEVLENENLLNPYDISLQYKCTAITDVLVDYVFEIASVKINLGINFHHRNLYYYVERVILTRKKDETSYFPDRNAWLRLQKNPDVLRLILQNFRLKRPLNSLLCEMFQCPQLDWRVVKRSLTVIMELEEEKLMALTEKFHQVFVGLIAMLSRKKKPNMNDKDIEFVQQFCMTLISYGLPVFDVDLDIVYQLFGHGDFFNTLLHMDIQKTHSPRFNPLSYCVFRADYQDATEHQLNHIMNMQHARHLLDTVDIPYLRSFTYMILNKEDYKQLRLAETYFGDVPKLIDLARACARDFLCSKFRITSSSKFYTMLKHVCLPTKIKKMLSFEIPLYEYDEIPSRQIQNKNFQRMKTWILEENMSPYVTMDQSML